MFIFDTDHLGILQRSGGLEFENLTRRLSQFAESDFFVTIVSFHEQVNGWTKYISRAQDSAGAARGYQKLEVLLSDFAQAQVLPFASAAADVYDDLRRQRIRVATMDLRIASIAIVSRMTLLTRNTVDFARIPGLSIEDWTVN